MFTSPAARQWSANGHDYYLGAHGSPQSHAEYQRLISEWLASYGQSPGRRAAETGGKPGSGQTINEMLVSYWQFARTYYTKRQQPTGEQQALMYAMKPLAELYGHAQPGQPAAEHPGR